MLQVLLNKQHSLQLPQSSCSLHDSKISVFQLEITQLNLPTKWTKRLFTFVCISTMFSIRSTVFGVCFYGVELMAVENVTLNILLKSITLWKKKHKPTGQVLL